MTIIGHSAALAVAALALGLAVSGCTGSSESGGPAATTATVHAPEVAAATDTDLAALVPSPANATTSTGPDRIADGGIHLHYQVGGAPGAALAAYRAALADRGWTVTTIITSEGGNGGGATYTGTHGSVYGVFDGGGFDSATYIDVCTWPTKPAEPNCTRGKR